MGSHKKLRLSGGAETESARTIVRTIPQPNGTPYSLPFFDSQGGAWKIKSKTLTTLFKGDEPTTAMPDDLTRPPDDAGSTAVTTHPSTLARPNLSSPLPVDPPGSPAPPGTVRSVPVSNEPLLCNLWPYWFPQAWGPLCIGD